jgi:hypothetical protein
MMTCHERIQDKANPDDVEWVFDLLEKIFEENDSSTGQIKENGMSKANPRQNVTCDSEWIYDLLEKIFEKNDSSLKEVRENEMSQAGPG